MSYETGTATSINDALDKLRLFAVAQGWTQNRWQEITGGNELCISKNDAYFNFRSGEAATMLVSGSNGSNRYGIIINGSDGYNESAAWDRQPGYSRREITPSASDQYHAFLPLVNNFGALPSYHFFAPNQKSIHIEIEIATGVYHRLGFGSLDVYNAAVIGGGRYFYGVCSQHVNNSLSFNSWLGTHIMSSSTMEEVPFRAAGIGLSRGRAGSAVRCAFDSFNGWAGSANGNSSTLLEQACQGGAAHDRVLLQSGANQLNGVGLLTPIIVSANRSNSSLSPIGQMPGVRYMDMTNYTVGEQFTIGADTWQVFPWYSKGGRSQQLGIAHKRVD